MAAPSQIVQFNCKEMEDKLKRLALKVSHHEDNIRFLKSQLNAVEEACIDLGIKLGNYHSSMAAVANNDTSAQEAEQRTIRSILNQDKTAAGIICQLKVRHHELASKMPLMKDILGFVATLGKVNNDNLSRLLTEYLGMDNMLALVCKTYDGVKGLEKYDKDGIIDKTSGVHGLGRSVGKFLDGRFTVFCLENLRPFSGDVNIDDPQRKLILHRPRLPGGESPPGFLDFAVNMIHLDRAHLSCLTASGHGLRETLFYTLFSHLQVYKTRADIQSALPLIKDGAVSLDGGMLRPNGSFCLGDSKNLEVKFPVNIEVSSLPENITEMEEQVKLKNWEKERVLEDMKREEDLLKQVKELYRKQKQELMDYLSHPAATQTSRDLPTTHSPATPGSNPFGAKPSQKRWMEPFHLLEPYYEENHRGRLTTEGEELYPLRPRTHDKFEDMRYDDRYTPLLERAGLDVVSFQVRRGLPAFNPAAISALVDRWRPETHSFHLPCGEMTVTLQDTQKFLGVRISGRPVIGHCTAAGWRGRVELFLGRELSPETPGTRSSGVLISWLRQNFGQCPDHADEQIVTYYCRAWIMHLFGCVLFPDGTGDTASWMYLPCLTDWHTAGGYSWGSAVLGYLYRQLCEACRRSSPNSSLGGCVYLLQLWMWSRLPVGRPKVLDPRPWFEVHDLRRRPTYAFLWDQVKGPFARSKRAYIEFVNELDALTPGLVSWEPYDDEQYEHIGFSTMCKMDEDLYLMRCPLICFYAVEFHLPHRVARQFGLRQEWPVKPFSTSINLHKIDRRKQKKETDFETLHRDYIDHWENFHENLYENDQPHTNENFRAYLSWYRQATRTKLKVQWTQTDYADIESSDDEQTSYDLATRAGTQVEPAPILDRVGNALRQSVIEIERFPRTGVDEPTLNNFLGRLARRLRRAAARCGCSTSAAMDVHGPHS